MRPENRFWVVDLTILSLDFFRLEGKFKISQFVTFFANLKLDKQGLIFYLYSRY